MKCPKIQTLRENFVKNRSLEQAGKYWALHMLHNSRDKEVDDFVTAFKTNKKIYKEKLEMEKERLRKYGLKGKAMNQRANTNIKFFDIKFRSKKKKLVESFYIRYKD